MTKKAIFFDLDHTLWDYERNAAEALVELYDFYELNNLGIPTPQTFVDAFGVANTEVWDLYDQNLITQTELRFRRFRQVFDQLGVSDHSLCDELNDEYLRISPLKPHLMSGAIETLDYLLPKYDLHLITNGFVEIQGQKLTSSKIDHYFKEMFTSQRAGAKKPDPRIFEYVLDYLHLQKNDVVMIGDNAQTDIKGANLVGIDTVYYNPEGLLCPQATFSICSLLTLKDLF